MTAVEQFIKNLQDKFPTQMKLMNSDNQYLLEHLTIEAKKMEQQQMAAFGKAVAEKWSMIPVPMSNIKEMLDESQITWWGGNPGMNNDVKTTGEKKISDLPLTMSMDEIKTHVNKSMGETTIEFPKQADLLVAKKREPEPQNPNKPTLDEMTFRFTQEANCVDGTSDDVEELIVEAKSSLGIDNDGGAFYVLRTEQWAIDDVNDFEEIRKLLKRVEAAVNAINPTTIHK